METGQSTFADRNRWTSGGGAFASEQLPDSGDEVFLAVALAAQVRYLVIGNLKHYPAKSRQGIRVVSPRDFLELYLTVEVFFVSYLLSHLQGVPLHLTETILEVIL